jgi:hypothetical protein
MFLELEGYEKQNYSREIITGLLITILPLDQGTLGFPIWYSIGLVVEYQSIVVIGSMKMDGPYRFQGTVKVLLKKQGKYTKYFN